MVKCKEDYDTLRTSLQNVIKEVNSLSKEKVLEVDGKQLKIQLYLGGDYKVNKSRHNYFLTTFFERSKYMYVVNPFLTCTLLKSQ